MVSATCKIWIWCQPHDSTKLVQEKVYHCIASPLLLKTEGTSCCHFEKQMFTQFLLNIGFQLLHNTSNYRHLIVLHCSQLLQNLMHVVVHNSLFQKKECLYTGQASHSDHWQVTWIIFSSSWHLLLGGIYEVASEHCVLNVGVLEERKLGKLKEVKWVWQALNCGVVSDEPATGQWAVKAH